MNRRRMLELVEGADGYKTTAGVLSRVLYGDEDAMNKGYHIVPELGSNKIPVNARVTLVPTGSHKHQLVVRDAEGGWIGDRFGPVLGARDSKKVLVGLGLGGRTWKGAE